ncbi:MAG TPA: hypothetical protein VHL11_12820 [Phototrophicaceae bacterium]|jgi:hypothetical protein|nr:hypothetical protein [Phototrophicaceae bacterium]
MTIGMVQHEVSYGAKFVQFRVAVFIFALAYWRLAWGDGDIHFIPAGKSTLPLVLRYSLGMSLLLPFGPIIGLIYFFFNLYNPKIVTLRVMQSMGAPAAKPTKGKAPVPQKTGG